ncbi:hypothetical protein [Serpentinicella alkaliphila]|uniref:Uncharacterized protein n=1 Tax=Serpentinicella alkaliphila TaxID=1734049 RepID=A0A4R2TF26_9FIRM|nr:hypothetical protein [Serpentinicella alkaliphila]QUH25893.1 hypothetical protein HZR23_09195 [Serpentinicella alkaliphila]TCQ01958.1 hypothetical protein EDD79_102014 [Serpentinicella alkaliphila]
MKKMSSEELEKCLKYADITNITATDYGTFIRAMVYTIQKNLPIEIVDNSNNIIKAQIKSFSLTYIEGDEGRNDILDVEYYKSDEEILHTLEFDKIGTGNVVKDRKSGTRTFYRYYINMDNKQSFRFTFNRRISKA